MDILEYRHLFINVEKEHFVSESPTLCINDEGEVMFGDFTIDEEDGLICMAEDGSILYNVEYVISIERMFDILGGLIEEGEI